MRYFHALLASAGKRNTPYEILSLKRDAMPAEIKKRYYELAKQLHPDVSTGEAHRFQEVKRAYEFLSQPSQRLNYLETGMGWDTSAAPTRTYRPANYGSAYHYYYDAHYYPQGTHSPRYMRNSAFMALVVGAALLAGVFEYFYFKTSQASLLRAADRHHMQSSHNLRRARVEARLFGNEHAVERMMEDRMRHWRKDSSASDRSNTRDS